jgi:hypothetical protein
MTLSELNKFISLGKEYHSRYLYQNNNIYGIYYKIDDEDYDKYFIGEIDINGNETFYYHNYKNVSGEPHILLNIII